MKGKRATRRKDGPDTLHIRGAAVRSGEEWEESTEERNGLSDDDGDDAPLPPDIGTAADVQRVTGRDEMVSKQRIKHFSLSTGARALFISCRAARTAHTTSHRGRD